MCGARFFVLLVIQITLVTGQELIMRCHHLSCQHIDYSTYEVEGKNIEIYLNDMSIFIDCNGTRALDSLGMPRAVSRRCPTYVELRSCPLPVNGSLADVLAAINITLDCNEAQAPGEPRGELLLSSLPIEPQLNAIHFTGLSRLNSLQIYGQDYTSMPNPQHGFLTPLGSLRSLSIWNTKLPTVELDVPTTLNRLDLTVNSLERLPVVATLDFLRLSGWGNTRPKPLTNCTALRELHINNLTATTLPDKWLTNCSSLEMLDITEAYGLIEIPSNLLFGNSNLTDLIIWNGILETLPAGLLDHSPNLRMLKLSGNYLKTLPSAMFAVARRVQNLDLTSNKLDGSAMKALIPLEELTELHLQRNPSLGDVCENGDYSPIRNLVKLKKLLMHDTGISRICRDWRQEMTALDTLDLSRTKLTKLSFEDLQFTRTVKAEVVLNGAPITVLEMTREEFNNVDSDLSSSVSVQLDAVLNCDCRMYWMRRALNLSLPVFQNIVGELACGDGRKLRDVSPEKLICSVPEECTAAALPAACSCAARPEDNSRYDRLLVRVQCENTLLTRVPRPQPLNRSQERLYELLLRHNHINELHAEDLQHNIKVIDLRNNLLRRIDEATTVKIGSLGILRLAGNPIDCSCHAAPFLRALQARVSEDTERGEATCDNGTALYAAPAIDCSSGLSLAAWLAIALGVLIVLVVGSAIFIASRERRFFMMAMLHRWGLTWPAAESDEEAGRRYDAFLTFSHKDEAVVYELMQRLEPTYRLCMHQRDWIPGRSICEQVVQSVRESRRTVALVSRHFLTSSWTLAEFREAHTAAMLDAKPRLVVILLEDPAKLNMDEQLRRYVSTHTYVRWGDPWFWDKLAVSLPRPRTSPPILITHEPSSTHLVPLLPNGTS